MRLWKDIKNYEVIDGWLTSPEKDFRAKIGNGAKIGDGAMIGNGAEIGNWVEIGDGAKIGTLFPQIWLMGKWWLHPYSPGIVRLGCYIGDYETLRNRKNPDWDKHGYTDAHVRVILSTLDYFEAIERDVFDFDYKPEVMK